MSAPIPNSFRIDFIDREGRVYRTVWGTGSQAETNNTGHVVLVDDPEAGRFPLGDCTRTTAYDDRCEPISTVWAACPPAAWPPTMVATIPVTIVTIQYGSIFKRTG